MTSRRAFVNNIMHRGSAVAIDECYTFRAWGDESGHCAWMTPRSEGAQINGLLLTSSAIRRQ